MASAAGERQQHSLSQSLVAGDKAPWYVSAAAGGLVISLAMRQMDCGASAFSAFTCSLSLFCALACLLHALVHGGLDVLGLLARAVTIADDIDDRVVELLKRELSRSILIEGSLAFFLTVALDNLESNVIVQRLQVVVMVALSYKAVVITNALAALGLDSLGSAFNNNFILLMVRRPKVVRNHH